MSYGASFSGGVLVITNHESLQPVTLLADKKKLAKDEKHKAPLMKQLLAALITPENVAPAATGKRIAKVGQQLGTLGDIVAGSLGQLDTLKVALKVCLTQRSVIVCTDTASLKRAVNASLILVARQKGSVERRRGNILLKQLRV